MKDMPIGKLTDQELKRLLDSFPVSPGIIRLQCLKCGEAWVVVLAVGETLEQARERFAAGHKGYCRAVTGQAIPHFHGSTLAGLHGRPLRGWKQ